MENIKLFTYICKEKYFYDLVKVNDIMILEDGTKLKIMYKYFNPKSLQYILYGKVIKEGENDETTNNRNI